VSLLPEQERGDALEAIERIVEHEPEADEILRQTVAVLHARIPDARGVAVAFVEEGALAPGPIAGSTLETAPAIAVEVLYERRPVAELWIDAGGEPDAADRAFLARISDLLSPYCLVGWDTGGEAWEP
jgi:hypothetical protein